MGTVRTALALLVVLAHIAGLDPLGANPLSGGAVIAVNLFFMISGFYMALVLRTQYAGRLADFYLSRALRLYPLYWITMIMSIVTIILFPSGVLHGIGENWQKTVASEAFWIVIPAALANLSLLGLEYGEVLCIDLGTGRLVLAGTPHCTAMNGYTIVPQAWTLGLEVIFYLLIPFLLKGGRKLVLLAFMMGVAFNAYLLGAGQHNSPWDRMMFPAVLPYFMLGVLSHSLYLRVSPFLMDMRSIWPLFAAVYCAMIVGYTLSMRTIYFQPGGEHFLDTRVDPFIYLAAALLIPFLFHASKSSRIDSWIGEFSYPVYIMHILVLVFSVPLADALNLDRGLPRFSFHIGAIAICTGLAILSVTQPVERLRDALKNRINSANRDGDGKSTAR